jgi:hypothetical protein
MNHMKYEVISADSHINEPPGTWIDRVPAKFKDAAPRIVPTSDGGEGWKFPDEPQIHSFGLVSATLQRGEARAPERYIPSGLKFDTAGFPSTAPRPAYRTGPSLARLLVARGIPASTLRI